MLVGVWIRLDHGALHEDDCVIRYNIDAAQRRDVRGNGVAKALAHCRGLSAESAGFLNRRFGFAANTHVPFGIRLGLSPGRRN